MQLKNPLVFGLLGILLVGGSIIPAMSQTTSEEDVEPSLEVSFDKSVYHLNTPLTITGKIIGFTANSQVGSVGSGIHDRVEVNFLNAHGKFVGATGYEHTSESIPLSYKIFLDEDGNFEKTVVLNSVLFELGTYKAKVTAYQDKQIIETYEFDITPEDVIEEEESVKEDRITIELCKSTRADPLTRTVIEDLMHDRNVECSGDNNFETGDNLIVKGKLNRDDTWHHTLGIPIYVTIPYPKALVFETSGQYETTTGTPVLDRQTTLLRNLGFSALPDEEGNFSGIFEIRPQVFITGSYAIHATYVGNVAETTAYITDNSIVQTKPEFTVTTDKSEYLPGEIVKISGQIKNVYYFDSVRIVVNIPVSSGYNCADMDCVVEKSEIMVTPEQGQTTHTFSWDYQLPSNLASIGEYKIRAGSAIGEAEALFIVVEDILVGETSPTSSLPKKIIEKFNRIADSDILISLGQKNVEDSELLPRVIQGSLFTSARGQEADVNIQVSTPTGVCVVGQSNSCLVNDSTRKPGQIYEIVTIDDTNYKIRYSGADVRLEKFSILPELDATQIDIKDWNVQVIKDDQPSRFYYKISYVNLE